LIIQIKS